MLIIGIDCAVQSENTGLALSEWNGREILIKEARQGKKNENIAETASRWIENTEKTLLALDAPLGWPEDLAPSLIRHQAGQRVDLTGNHFFRRETDNFVKEKLGKQPLDVGADRIARTALKALQILEEIRNKIQLNIPLAWSPDFRENAAVEVYPAAWLLSEKIAHQGYKKNPGIRKAIVDQIKRTARIPDPLPLLESDDVLDAVICTLCAVDFLRGKCFSPRNSSIARTEGWIWFKGFAS
jgi:predicted RNase H-like nuclease